MYKKRDSIAKLFDISMRMVDTITKEISECGRYPKDAVLRDEGYVLLDVDVFQDYLFNRKNLKNKTTAKLVPEYKRNRLRYLNALD